MFERIRYIIVAICISLYICCVIQSDHNQFFNPIQDLTNKNITKTLLCINTFIN